MLLSMDEEFHTKPKLNVLGEPETLFVEPKPATPVVSREEDVPFVDPRAVRADEPALASVPESAPVPTPAANVEAITPAVEVPKTRRGLPFKKIGLAAGAAVVILGIAFGGLTFFKHRQAKQQAAAAAASAQKQATPVVNIPVYVAKNLPTGYVFNHDAKALKANVYYYSIAGPSKKVFYVTQQQIPASFDFTTFNKKFLNPDTFSTGSGTATVGPVGSNMLGSIRTNKNTWIIINSSPGTTLAELESVVRSFDL